MVQLRIEHCVVERILLFHKEEMWRSSHSLIRYLYAKMEATKNIRGGKGTPLFLEGGD